jgi:hypothetical protein
MNLAERKNANLCGMRILAIAILTTVAALMIGCGGSANSPSCTTTGVTTAPQITSLADPSHEINIPNPSDGQVPIADVLLLPCESSSLPTMYINTTGGQCPFKFTMTQNVTNGPSSTFAGLSLNSSTGAVIWAPNPNNCALTESGSVTFGVTDANGNSANPAMTVPVQLVF